MFFSLANCSAASVSILRVGSSVVSMVQKEISPGAVAAGLAGAAAAAAWVGFAASAGLPSAGLAGAAAGAAGVLPPQAASSTAPAALAMTRLEFRSMARRESGRGAYVSIG